MAQPESISFDRIADRYDATRGGEVRGRQFAPDLGKLLRSDRPALEIGIGTGVIGLALRELGFDVVGLDISQAMLRYALERLGDVIAQADAMQLPVRTGSLDQAYSVWVLHVVADPATVMREVARVLRPGGRYLVMDGHFLDLEGDDPIAVAWREIQTGLGLEVHKDHVPLWSGIAPECGLRVVDVVQTDPYPFFASITDTANRIETRANSWMWDVPDDQWKRVVVPVIERLRALPDADEPMQRFDRQQILVLER